MKKLSLFSVFAIALFALTACTTTKPATQTIHEVPIDQEAFKIKKVAPISYKMTSVGKCHDVQFLTQYAGKTLKEENGEKMHIDNIVDIHISMMESNTSLWGSGSVKHYDCEFWGLAVEYVK